MHLNVLNIFFYKNWVVKNQLLKLQDAKNQSFADTPISAHSSGMLDFMQLIL